jgi:uncharacterized protein YcbK (DUF882 family)
VTARGAAVWSATLALFVSIPGAAKPPPRHRGHGLPAGYRAHVARWHAREPGAAAPKDAHGRPKLVLEAINLRERVELVAASDDGAFDEAERARAAHVLRDSRGNAEHAIDAALLDLLYRLERHFDAPCIRVVSAYRVPHGGKTSQHGRGRAADVVVPGAKDKDVAAFARTLGTTGVGLYPVSGFVHVDVRERGHYWVDWSGPGQHRKPVRHAHGKAAHHKKAAHPKGSRPHG